MALYRIMGISAMLISAAVGPREVQLPFAVYFLVTIASIFMTPLGFSLLKRLQGENSYREDAILEFVVLNRRVRTRIVFPTLW